MDAAGTLLQSMVGEPPMAQIWGGWEAVIEGLDTNPELGVGLPCNCNGGGSVEGAIDFYNASRALAVLADDLVNGRLARTRAIDAVAKARKVIALLAELPDENGRKLPLFKAALLAVVRRDSELRQTSVEEARQTLKMRGGDPPRTLSVLRAQLFEYVAGKGVAEVPVDSALLERVIEMWLDPKHQSARIRWEETNRLARTFGCQSEKWKSFSERWSTADEEDLSGLPWL